MFTPAAVSDDARLEMAGEKLYAEGIESGTHSGDLVENVNAVAVLFDHPLHPGNLSGDTSDALLQFAVFESFDPNLYTGQGYMAIRHVPAAGAAA